MSSWAAGCNGSGGSDTADVIKIKYESNPDTNAFTDAEKNKLTVIEDNATADQTGSEIQILYEALADVNRFTDALKAKLDAIAAGATANSSDATLLNRANHTGTQLASTISDLSSAITNNSAVLANTAKVTNATHTGDVTGSGALTIANNAVSTAKIANSAVTNAKMANMTADTVKGRQSTTGAPTDLSMSTLRTMLNVENGATADQSDSEIETAYNNQVSTVSQAEAEAGTSTTVRRWTAQRVAQAIAALAGSSGGFLPSAEESNDTAYTIVAGDVGKLKYLPTSGTNDRDWTLTPSTLNTGSGWVAISNRSTSNVRIKLSLSTGNFSTGRGDLYLWPGSYVVLKYVSSTYVEIVGGVF